MSQQQQLRSLARCVGCGEPVDPSPTASITLAACGHTYCGSCLRRHYTASRSLPPACCSAMPATDEPVVKALLGPDLVRRLEIRSAEAQDPDCTYCAAPQCSAYIPQPDCARTDRPPSTAAPDVGAAAQCPDCGASTCRRCKQSHGDGHQCDPSWKTKTFEPVLALAQTMRWRRCFRCRTMVEKKPHGCDHMT